jgi:hypothetical protein
MRCRHIQRNPDEELRRLERAAASGDAQALDRLHHQRARHGLPTHYHDCDSCIFLGSATTAIAYMEEVDVEYLGCNHHFYDFYFCGGPASSLSGSLIARFACNPSQYQSRALDVHISMPMAHHRGPIQRAYELALARGLIP